MSEVATTTSWIKARAEEIRQAEKRKKAEWDRQISLANELKAKTEPFWKELLGILDESVKEFNQEFPEAERRIDHYDKPSVTGLSIRRSAYPAVTVKLTLNIAGTSIQYSISSTARKGANTSEQQANLTIGLVDGKVGYLDGGIGSHEEAAMRMLEPFFEF